MLQKQGRDTEVSCTRSSVQMKIFAALALVTLFCCLEVALGYPRYPVRQQQYHNTLQKDTATAQGGVLKYCFFTMIFFFFHAAADCVICYRNSYCSEGYFTLEATALECCRLNPKGSARGSDYCRICSNAARM